MLFLLTSHYYILIPINNPFPVYINFLYNQTQKNPLTNRSTIKLGKTMIKPSTNNSDGLIPP